MLSSANGRHRRPRQAPAAMVAVAATGAGIALPLLGTGVGAAQAADSGTWNKVAICETGGQWDQNTDNGFYGGLSLTQDIWVRYGGLRYAARPDLATRSEQITVAEKLLKELGPDAWPGCELGTGLLDDDNPPAGDQGDDEGGHSATPAPGTSADPGTPTDGAATPAVPTTPATPGTPSTPSATPTDPANPSDAATPPATASPSDPGTPSTTPTDPAGSGTPSAGSGRHARPYSPTDEALAAADRASRTLTTGVTEGAPDANAGDKRGNGDNSGNAGNTGTKPQKAPSTYKIGAGDSLSGIAAEHGLPGGWHRLYDANQQLIGDDPNLIKPGQIIDLG